ITPPLHYGRERAVVIWPRIGPMGQRDGWHRFHPGPSGRRDGAVHRTKPLSDRKQPLTPSHSFHQFLVAVHKSNLRESWVSVNKTPSVRELILVSPTADGGAAY